MDLPGEIEKRDEDSEFLLENCCFGENFSDFEVELVLII